MKDITNPKYFIGFLVGMSVTFIFLSWLGALHEHEEHPTIRRVKELQYGTINYIILDSTEKNMFFLGDTIWLDRRIHRYDAYNLDVTKVVIIK